MSRNEWCGGWLFRTCRRRVFPLLRFSLNLAVVHGVYDLDKGQFKADGPTIGEAPHVGEQMTLIQGNRPTYGERFDVWITAIRSDAESGETVYEFRR